MKSRIGEKRMLTAAAGLFIFLLSFLLNYETAAMTPPSAPGGEKIIFLHHSTGACVYFARAPGSPSGPNNIPLKLGEYNTAHGTTYSTSEKYFCGSGTQYNTIYGWVNYPFDYWKIWIENAGPDYYLGEPTLEFLTREYDVVIFKHCYPVASILADTGVPDITSSVKRLENYKLQYNALKEKLHQYPNTKFIAWTLATMTDDVLAVSQADRGRTFVDWMKNVWDEPNDNIYIWNFYDLETGGDGLQNKFMLDSYAVNPAGDCHPNNTFSNDIAAPSFLNRIIEVLQANHAPYAGDQSTTTSANTAVNITLAATDADGNPLTYNVVAAPAHGALTGSGADRTYTPSVDYTGTDGFTFNANDGLIDSNTATVTITVTAAVNHAPVAQNQSVITDENMAKAITLAATDVDGNPLTYSIVTAPAHGTLTGSGANRTYTPSINYSGTDGFTFNANDGSVDSNIATVSITVTPVSEIPGTVYEDAENGDITGWDIYDAVPAGAVINNVYDSDRGSRVIQFSGTGMDNGYRLRKSDGTPWGNSSQFVIQWSMKCTEPMRIYVDVMTDTLNGTSYHRFLEYDSIDGDSLGTGEYVYFGLGSSVRDGQWHTIMRDLRTDLERAQPGVKILAVNAFLVRGSGMMDDISLLDSIPIPSTVYEDAENEDTAGWDVYDAVPAGAVITNVYDNDRGSRVIQFSGTGRDNGYRLRKADGTPWGNSSQFVLQWNMKYTEPMRVYVDVMTDTQVGTTYHRFLEYDSIDGDSLGTGEYVYFGLGSSVRDGQWHTITRDLRADLERAQPGVKILAVNAFLVRGSGMLDDISLLGETVIPNHAPVITGGPAANPNPVQLPGTASVSVSANDLDGDALIYTWEKVSGTGNVNFSPNGTTASSSSTAVFDGAGTYIIKVTVSDETDSVSGETTVTVEAPTGTSTVYEDAENGDTTGWDIYDAVPVGAVINNVYDNDRGSRVIQFSGTGTDNGYRLRKSDGTPWGNNSQFVIQWSMKYSENFTVYIDVMTDTLAGSSYHRYIRYEPKDSDTLGSGEYIYFGLGSSISDGQWHTVMRDLQADLERAQPGVKILAVNAFLIRGSGMLDDISLLDSLPPPATVYEDAENGDTTGWDVYDAVPVGAVINNVYDNDRGSRVIQFSGTGTDNGYRLRKSDGTPWGNSSQFVIQWSLKYSENFTVYIDVMTDTLAGSSYHRYIRYEPKDSDTLGSGEYIYFGLGSSMSDGQWHTVMRDLQADLERAQPGVKILAVNAFLIRGGGMLDDINLRQ